MEVGSIKRIVFASSVNALGKRFVTLGELTYSLILLGLLYGKKDPVFDYFPLDEKHPQRPSDSYALGKQVILTEAGFRS